MNWNYDMRQAPRDEFTQVLIAVKGSRIVRRCVWWQRGKQWSGLLSGEKPLCWCTVYHPEDRHAPAQLPKGMTL